MKALVRLVCLAIIAVPMFAQVSVSLVTTNPTGPASGSVSTNAVINTQYYWWWPGYENTTGSNWSTFSGNFQNGVTLSTGLQDQSLYLANQQLDPMSKVYIPDTTWTSKSYPVWGSNPNCTMSYYYVSCPPGQSWWIITEPLPQQANLDMSNWSNRGCYRTLANTQWTQYVSFGWYSYSYNYHTDSTSNWDGYSCSGTVTIQPVNPPSSSY